ncbi:retropepsin-like aspartic protease family protein [Porphyromonas gulae]|uniref:Aspartyl protease n=1 Tax=Porphyromonas gulae TaxID=111105 RepID=A0A0A2FE65_9PORP|nr:retropepsin-like aspartic protease [Porphyromonas gulae]KGN86694.1 hypothetical protein HR08_03405 [Porphyromonas gulae]
MRGIIFIMITMLICIACGKRQKPKERIDIWEENVDTAIIAKVSLSEEKVLVPFRRTESGLAEVQVSLNGIPFNMIWDTGASVTCISLLELQKLAKEDKISLDDYVGPTMSEIADGSTTKSAVFTIKEIFIQAKDNKHLILRDVAAMVSPNTKAPLLIGQNVISHLPKHSFNEFNEVIEFE